MALHGTFYRFSGEPNTWTVYHERLEQFCTLNDIHSDSKKKALLLNATDEYVYKILRGLCNPQLPAEKTYSELIALLNKHYVVRSSVFYERVKFYSVRQNAGDSIADWFAVIKSLSVECKFGVELDAILLDRFISGMVSSPILDRLCEEDEKISIERAVEIAKRLESSFK